jgi:uncharacterized protein (DUF433 family)
VLDIPLPTIITEVRQAIIDLTKRDPDQYGRIDRHRLVNANAPVFSGTRISVSAVQACLSEGLTIPQILAEFPSLTEEDVESARQLQISLRTG